VFNVSLVPGQWGAWKPWNVCPVTCGSGLRNRTRVCNNPPPTNGGRFCYSVGISVKWCDPVTCPGI